ncbi:MAG: (d)CMP kinase [Andreesenia angusta]|nr:(d)CMP kinase [Andreesenia angusta]
MVYSIAVDGPAGAGKSTVSKIVAKRLGIEYIDTGAMYRAFTLKLINENIGANDLESLKNILKKTEIDFINGHIYLDGKSVDKEIRENNVTERVSDISTIEIVREKLVDLQRNIAKNKSVIMDGRDIGTNVLKDSKYKFYLNASLDIRAKRRYEEIKDKGLSFEEIKKDINLRDEKDKNRLVSPLKKAKDAHEIDSSYMSTEEVVDYIIKYIEKEGN